MLPVSGFSVQEFKNLYLKYPYMWGEFLLHYFELFYLSVINCKAVSEARGLFKYNEISIPVMMQSYRNYFITQYEKYDE